MRATTIERRGSMCRTCRHRAEGVNVSVRDGGPVTTYRCLQCGRVWDDVRADEPAERSEKS